MGHPPHTHTNPSGQDGTTWTIHSRSNEPGAVVADALVEAFAAEVLSWHRPLAVPKDLVCQCEPGMRFMPDPIVLCTCGTMRCNERERAAQIGPLAYARELAQTHHPARSSLLGCSGCGRPHFMATRCVGLCHMPTAGLCAISRSARAAGLLPALPEEVFHAQHSVGLPIPIGTAISSQSRRWADHDRSG